MRLFRSLGVIVATLSMCAAVPAFGAQMVVIGVSGTDLRPGDIIESDSELKLPDGAKLTLIGPDGTPVQLAGPFDGKPGGGASAASSGGPDVVGALSQLFSVGGTTDTSLGATRNSSGTGIATPDPRAIPIGYSGDYCVVGGGPTYLWRLEVAEPSIVTLRAADGSWEGKQQFAAGQDRLPLPPNFPAAAEQAFTLEVGAETSDIVLHRMPSGLNKPGIQAAWLVGAGCDLQAKALLAALQ